MTQPINPEIANVYKRIEAGLNFQCLCLTEKHEQRIKKLYGEQVEVIHSMSEAWPLISLLAPNDTVEFVNVVENPPAPNRATRRKLKRKGSN